MTNKKKQTYTITLDSHLPTSKAHTFSDIVEEGIGIIRTEDNYYYIFHSNFIAKTLREIKLGIFGRHKFLFEHEPVEFVEKFLLGISNTKHYGMTPEARASIMYSKEMFQTSIFINAIEKYGREHVYSSNFPTYKQKGHESKTEYIDSFINTLEYKLIMEDGRFSSHE